MCQSKYEVFWKLASNKKHYHCLTHVFLVDQNRAKAIEQVALAADSLSLGDLVESRIRGRMAWSMLPVQAMYSSVLPGEYMSGQITSQIAFPGWLGKNSKTQKRSRLAQEIHDHTRIR